MRPSVTQCTGGRVAAQPCPVRWCRPVPEGQALEYFLLGAILASLILGLGAFLVGRWHYRTHHLAEAEPYLGSFLLYSVLTRSPWPQGRELPWIGLYMFLGWLVLRLLVLGRQALATETDGVGAEFTVALVAALAIALRRPWCWALLLVGIAGLVSFNLGQLVAVPPREATALFGVVAGPGLWAAMWLYIARRPTEFNLSSRADRSAGAAAPPNSTI